MLDEQKGLCGVCGEPLPNLMSNYCDLDHNHRTGQNRALVHRHCNLLIAALERQEKLIPAAMAYLAHHSRS